MNTNTQRTAGKLIVSIGSIGSLLLAVMSGDNASIILGLVAVAWAAIAFASDKHQ